jgi:hypothetical protein
MNELVVHFKKTNCSMVLPNQNKDIPAKNALPSLDVNNSSGYKKQIIANFI